MATICYLLNLKFRRATRKIIYHRQEKIVSLQEPLGQHVRSKDNNGRQSCLSAEAKNKGTWSTAVSRHNLGYLYTSLLDKPVNNIGQAAEQTQVSSTVYASVGTITHSKSFSRERHASFDEAGTKSTSGVGQNRVHVHTRVDVSQSTDTKRLVICDCSQMLPYGR